MVQLYTDILTDRITGYNTAIPEGYVDENLVGDECLPMLSKLGGRPLYLVNGQVVAENPGVDGGLYDEMQQADADIAEAQRKVDGEHKTFMDRIISGMTLDAARDAAKADRDALQALESRREALRQRHGALAQEAVARRFEREEEGLNPDYFLSMVAIVRNENEYLEEWVRYHVEEMGFEHFYIYDNESEVPVKDYLESVDFQYLDRITVIPWKTSRASQEDACNDFLANHSKQTKWFLAADPDEYVVPKDDSKTLREFLGESGQYATIKCLWRHYNANGQVSKTDGTDMERFTQSTDWEDWKHGGKKFAQSNRIARFRSYVPVERMGARTLDWDDAVATDFFRLNHYFTRSWEEWQQKIRRGSSNPMYRRKLSMFFELNPDMAYLDTGEDLEQGYGAADGKEVMGDGEYNGEE